MSEIDFNLRVHWGQSFTKGVAHEQWSYRFRAEVMECLPLPEFRACVARYQGEYKVRGFSCLDQFFCLAFAQLTYRESLRDIETCLRAMHSRLYHMGIRGRVARSTLADANETRDWRIYADFAQTLIGVAKPLYATEPFGVDLAATV